MGCEYSRSQGQKEEAPTVQPSNPAMVESKITSLEAVIGEGKAISLADFDTLGGLIHALPTNSPRFNEFLKRTSALVGYLFSPVEGENVDNLRTALGVVRLVALCAFVCCLLCLG
jgi:hypothetical protein